jgi:hypothetical protein
MHRPRIVRFSLVIALLGTGALKGEDSLVGGGRSPDGRYEVRIFQTESRDPSDYYYAVVDARRGEIVQRLSEGGGYSRYKGAATTASVLWHSSGEYFALTDHGSRHSMEMYLYAVTPRAVTVIRSPDYFQNALGRVNATEGYLTSVVKPLKWTGDDLVCDLIFDATSRTKGRLSYKTRFTLRLLHGPNTAPTLQFVNMEAPGQTE